MTIQGMGQPIQGLTTLYKGLTTLPPFGTFADDLASHYALRCRLR